MIIGERMGEFTRAIAEATPYKVQTRPVRTEDVLVLPYSIEKQEEEINVEDVPDVPEKPTPLIEKVYPYSKYVLITIAGLFLLFLAFMVV